MNNPAFKTSGYSGIPLARKLGIKSGFVISVIGAPDDYWQLFTDFPENVIISKSGTRKKNLIHYFATSQEKLLRDLVLLKGQLQPNCMIWVSWPKKVSMVRTDVTEDVVRKLAFQNGLVDIKVCAVDTTWSALKLVIPVKDRR